MYEPDKSNAMLGAREIEKLFDEPGLALGGLSDGMLSRIAIIIEKYGIRYNINIDGASKELWAAYVSRLPDMPSDKGVKEIGEIICRHKIGETLQSI